jgi:hypothetical protein
VKRNPPREPDTSGNRARLLTFLPDHGVAVLENRTHPPSGPAEQQVWTYRYATPPAEVDPLPAAPTGLAVRTFADRAVLSWKPSPSKNVARHAVLRGEGELPWKATLRRVATVETKQTAYEDKDVKPGTVYHYAVVAEDANGRAGPPSARARTQPALVETLVASVLSEKQVELTWQPPPGEDIVGYHVERAAAHVWSEDQLRRAKGRTPPLKEPSVASLRSVGEFRTLTEGPVKATRWTDRVELGTAKAVEGKPIWERRVGKDDIDPAGKPYRWAVFAYRVRAVNALGVPGGPSPWVLTIPSPPQNVFSREDGTRCELKWSANPEKGIQGYRIYRLDGRFDKQPVTRQTTEPIDRTAWTDPAAGKSARRYHVVAVDAIGQEGLPSAPVWFEREWKAFYKPFVGPWHQ